MKNEQNYYFTGIVGGGYPQYIYIYTYIYGGPVISSKIFVNSYTKPLNQSANLPPQYVESSSVSMTNTMSMAVCHCTQDLTYNVHGIFLRVASPFRTVKNVQFSGRMCQNSCRAFAKKTSSFRNLGVLASGVPGTISCIYWNNCWQFWWFWHGWDSFCSRKKCQSFWGIMKLQDMGVSENRGTPNSSILIGFSIIFTIHFGRYHYFWKHPSSDPTLEETLQWLLKWRAAQFGSSPFPPPVIQSRGCKHHFGCRFLPKPCGFFHPEISIAKSVGSSKFETEKIFENLPEVEIPHRSLLTTNPNNAQQKGKSLKNDDTFQLSS